MTQDLTTEQKKELVCQLRALLLISEERELASRETLKANQRWNDARQRYAALHADVVQKFGKEYAPIWLESIHGPQITREIT